MTWLDSIVAGMPVRTQQRREHPGPPRLRSRVLVVSVWRGAEPLGFRDRKDAARWVRDLEWRADKAQS